MNQTDPYISKEVTSHEQSNKFRDELIGTTWLGIVVDPNDPLKEGRARVKVFEKFDELEDDMIPWAYPGNSVIFAGGEGGYGGTFSYPKKGTIVRLTFENGDFLKPVYHAIENLNHKMLGEISDSYENAHVLLYDEDEDLKVIYTKKGGLLIYLRESIINIDKDTHITIGHSGKTSEMTYVDGAIEINSNSTQKMNSPHIHINSPDTKLGPSGHQPATRCGSLMNLLARLANDIDKVAAKAGTVTFSGTKVASASGICSGTVTVAV